MGPAGTLRAAVLTMAAPSTMPSHCVECHIGLVTKGTVDVPEGFRRHGGHGLCRRCFNRAKYREYKANPDRERIQYAPRETPHARPLSETELDYYRRGRDNFIQRRRDRLRKQARAALLGVA